MATACLTYLPSFRHALVDLPLIDDRALSAEARLRAFEPTSLIPISSAQLSASSY